MSGNGHNIQDRLGNEKKTSLGVRLLLTICIGLIGVVLWNIAGYLASSLPLPKPTPFATQSPNEILVIIADLENRSGSAENHNHAADADDELAQSIFDIVQEKVPGSKIRVERYLQPISAQDDAQQILTTNRALILVWGWYDKNSAEVVINLDTEQTELEIPMFSDVPAQYIAQFDLENPVPVINYSAFLVAGIARFHTRSETAAKELFSQAIVEADSAHESINTWAALFWRGLLFSFLTETRELAIVDFSAAIRLHPTKEVYYDRGFTYGDLGNPTLAFDNYSQAIELDEHYVKALYARGMSYYFQGKDELAIADLSHIIDIDPTYQDVYSLRGKIYSIQGELVLAMSDCNRAIALNPDSVNAYFLRGEIYKEWGMMDKAILNYQKTNELAPTANGYCILGKVYAQVGNFTAAIDSLERGVGLDRQEQYLWCREALKNAEKGTPTP